MKDWLDHSVVIPRWLAVQFLLYLGFHIVKDFGLFHGLDDAFVVGMVAMTVYGCGARWGKS